MPSNEHHKWLKKRDWPSVEGAMTDPDMDLDLLRRKYKERDEHGRLPHHWMAAKAQTHTHTLASVGVHSICWNEEALTTRDNKGETPLDIARRSGACAEIIGLLSLTPEEARSLGAEGMARLYAPVGYWRNEMVVWIQSRSYADCHKFINEHDDELVREVLKYYNSDLLLKVATESKVYSDSLVFLALRMIHRHPLSLQATYDNWPQGATLPDFAQNKNASKEMVKVLRLTPKYISRTSFPTLLRQHLPKQFVDEEVFGVYNNACTFIKHMKYDKAELVEVEDMLKKPTHKCDVCKTATTKACARCKTSYFCSAECQKSAWKKHKKTCKAPTREAANEVELRVLHEGMLLLNRCIQEPGAGDGPTSVVLDFLRDCGVPKIK